MPTPTGPELLDFEAAHPRHNGYKDEAIRRTFGIPPARYYVVLARAARSLEGWEHDPFTADRVIMRSLRSERRSA